jgi:hypothetical protein
MITAHCPQCRAEYETHPDFVGRPIRCRKCGHPHRIGEADGLPLPPLPPPPPKPVPGVDYSESVFLRVVAACFVTFGLLSTLSGLLGLLSDRGVAVIGGFLSIGVGVLIKLLAVVEGMAAYWRGVR